MVPRELSCPNPDRPKSSTQIKNINCCHWQLQLSSNDWRIYQTRAAENDVPIIEKADEIQALDQAAQERISAATQPSIDFDDDAILMPKEADEDNQSGFNFDSEEQIIEEETEDLTLEMMGTKIQKQLQKS